MYSGREGESKEREQEGGKGVRRWKGVGEGGQGKEAKGKKTEGRE